MSDRALRHVQGGGELRRARRALAEEPDDPPAREITERAELPRIGDEKDVVELVVGIMVDDRGTYGIRRPFVKRERGRAPWPGLSLGSDDTADA
jgi:hypothetical protein